MRNIKKDAIQSKNSKDLSLLFTVLIDYLSVNSNKLDDKLVSQVSLLLTLQVIFENRFEKIFFIFYDLLNF